MVSPHITAEVVEASEFMDLAGHYAVYGVPKTIINDKYEIEGAVPEPVFLSNVMKAVQ